MTNTPYEILEHTADIGLKVHGRTLPELFENAARGLVALALGTPEAVGDDVVPLSADGSNREDLLVAWLNDILFHIDAEGWTFHDFRVSHIGHDTITGKGRGERHNPSEGLRAVRVKAVTYHQVSVRETADGWEAVVYFDI